jgi:hypothetical protein
LAIGLFAEGSDVELEAVAVRQPDLVGQVDALIRRLIRLPAEDAVDVGAGQLEDADRIHAERCQHR